MKIALNILHFRASQGGAEGYAVRLANGLARRGHGVHVFSRTFERNGPSIVHHPVRPLSWPLFLRELSFALRSRAAIQQERFDVVMGFGKTLRADVVRTSGGLHSAWLAQDLESLESGTMRALKRTARAISPRHWIAELLERRQLAAPSCRRVVVLSEGARREIVRVHRLPPERVVVVRNGVDLNRFHPERRRTARRELRDRHGLAEEVIILFMANNFRLKGLGPLIHAVAGLRREAAAPLVCLVVGRGRPQSFERLAERLGVRRQFIFAGPTDRPEDYYAAADVLAHPTFYDTFGNVCLEAMAGGLPVITTALCGASEIMTSGHEGVVIRHPRNVNALAQAITRYLDPSERQRAGLAARRLAEQFSDEQNCDTILKVFEDLIEERAASRE